MGPYANNSYHNLLPLSFSFPPFVIRSQVISFSTLHFISMDCNASLMLRQPWTYCLGNFPRAPVQRWRYQRNQCTRIFTPTLKRGEGGIFPTFETKIVAIPTLIIQFISNYAYYQYFLQALTPALTFTLKHLVT